MTAPRFTSRGRNQWHSDGRPAGFGMPFARDWPVWQALAAGALVALGFLAGWLA